MTRLPTLFVSLILLSAHALACSEEFSALSEPVPRYSDRVFAFAASLGLAQDDVRGVTHGATTEREAVDRVSELLAIHMERSEITPLGLIREYTQGDAALMARIDEWEADLSDAGIRVGWAYEWGTFWVEDQRYIAVNPALPVDGIRSVPAVLSAIAHEYSHSQRTLRYSYSPEMTFDTFKSTNIFRLVSDETAAIKDGYDELERWIRSGYQVPEDILTFLGYENYVEHLRPLILSTTPRRLVLLREALTELTNDYVETYRHTWDQILVGQWLVHRRTEFLTGLFEIATDSTLSEAELGSRWRAVVEDPRWHPVTEELIRDVDELFAEDFDSLSAQFGQIQAHRMRIAFLLGLSR